MRTVKEALKQKLVQEGVVGHEGKIPKGQLAPPVQGGHQATKVRVVAQAARQPPGTADSVLIASTLDLADYGQSSYFGTNAPYKWHHISLKLIMLNLSFFWK